MRNGTRSDGVAHLTAADGRVRGLAALTTATVEEARWRHGMYPTAAAAFGRTLTAAAMLAAGMKGNEKVMIEVAGDGPLGAVVAEIGADGAARGYVQRPRVHLPLNSQGKLDVAKAVGKGRFCVTKDLRLREPYRGVVPLISGEIGEDFAYYLHTSEQTPSAVALGVLVGADNAIRAAGGVAIQLMPGADRDESLIGALEERMSALTALSRRIDEGASPVDLLADALQGWDPKEVGWTDVRFDCSCAKERFAKGLIALGKEELQDIVAEQGGAELVCQFCDEAYEFSEADLTELIEEFERPAH